MINRIFDFWEVDWAENTDASYSRVMRALVKYNGSMSSSYCTDINYKRSAVFYSIKLPVGYKEEFEKDTKTELKRHPDICIGHEVSKSQKQINYNTTPATIIYDEVDCKKDKE